MEDDLLKIMVFYIFFDDFKKQIDNLPRKDKTDMFLPTCENLNLIVFNLLNRKFTSI